MKKRLNNLLLLHIVVFIYGFTGILGKLIESGAEKLVFWRMLIASLTIVIWIHFTKKIKKPIDKTVLKYLLLGFVIAAHWITFFGAIKLSNVSVTLACLSASTLFTALIEPFFFKRKLRLYEIILGLFIIGGLALIFSFETEYVAGIIVALISSFLASFFTVVNGIYIREDNSYRISQYEMIGGVVGISLYLLYRHFAHGVDYSLLSIPPMDWFYIAILGIVCTAFAFVASVKVMEEISPFTVSLSINLEPVYGIILAFLIFGASEKMTFGFYGGTILILGALYLNAMLRKGRIKLPQFLNSGPI